MTTFNLAEAYANKQTQLVAKLQSVSQVSHPTEKGDISEEAWRTLLGDLLPQRYEVSRASIVDCRGGRSEAIDVVIHDRHFSPLVFLEGSTKLLPAESVYGVFECKQELDRENLTYAAGKAASVRALHRTSATVVHVGGHIAQPKPPPHILAGVLATRGGWTPPLGTTFRSHLQFDQDHVLDLGCIAAGGAWEVHGEPPHLTVADATRGLAFFLVRLLARLQMMGTVPAMDYESWAVPLE